MKANSEGLELSVSILMDDLVSAKEIALALRTQDVLAHHYQSLDEFWVATNIQIPDLIIIDVTKMSQGSIQFRNHPKVIDGTLCYSFFSKDSTKILIQSTLGLKPYSYLHLDSSLAVQVSVLLNRKKKEIRLEKELTEMELRVQRLQSRSQRFITERSEAEEFKAQFDFVKNICSEIEISGAKQGFTYALVQTLEQWEVVDGYGIFELNQSGQKLISPDFSKKKFHPFPSLWLGQINLDGIELFAQDMAVQVANDLFDKAPKLIKILGGKDHPDILLFITFNPENMSNFPWTLFEFMLSSSFRQLKLSQEYPKQVSQMIPSWEALDQMDRIQKTGSDSSDVRIVSLSFIPVCEVIKKRPQNKFFWSAFYNEVFLQLTGRLQKSTKISVMGPWQILIFIHKEKVEVDFHALQAMIKNLHVWKYFEDDSQILSEEMMPLLKLIPASSAHYLSLFEKDFQEVLMNSEAKRMILNEQNSVKRMM